MPSRSFFSRLKNVFNNPTTEDPAKAAEERLEEIIEDAEREGLIDDEASEMFQGIIDLVNTTAGEVMVPRINLTAVPDDISVLDLMKEIVDSGHSRIPVYHESIDRVVGIIYVKDLFQYWGRESEIDVQTVMRTPYFIPESKPLTDLLADFKSKKVQVAIVVDEYGGTSGLVSMEDILEEIVGEIADEYDIDEENEWFEAENGHVHTTGQMSIFDLADHFDVEAPEGAFTTIGGWIYERIGRIPETREEFDFDGFHVVIDDADPRQINKLTISVAAEPPEFE